MWWPRTQLGRDSWSITQTRTRQLLTRMRARAPSTYRDRYVAPPMPRSRLPRSTKLKSANLQNFAKMTNPPIPPIFPAMRYCPPEATTDTLKCIIQLRKRDQTSWLIQQSASFAKLSFNDSVSAIWNITNCLVTVLLLKIRHLYLFGIPPLKAVKLPLYSVRRFPEFSKFSLYFPRIFGTHSARVNYSRVSRERWWFLDPQASKADGLLPWGAGEWRATAGFFASINGCATAPSSAEAFGWEARKSITIWLTNARGFNNKRRPYRRSVSYSIYA